MDMRTRSRFENLCARYLSFRSTAEERELLELTESALAKDWLTPEEDESWMDL